jgi:hypothetical protein
MAVTTEFKGERGHPRVGVTREGGAHNMGLRPDTIQGLKSPKIADAAPLHVHTE